MRRAIHLKPENMQVRIFQFRPGALVFFGPKLLSQFFLRTAQAPGQTVSMQGSKPVFEAGIKLPYSHYMCCYSVSAVYTCIWDAKGRPQGGALLQSPTALIQGSGVVLLFHFVLIHHRWSLSKSNEVMPRASLACTHSLALLQPLSVQSRGYD